MADFRNTVIKKDVKEDAELVRQSQYPCLHLPLKFIPEAEKWSMENDYEIKLLVRVNSITRNRVKDDEGKDEEEKVADAGNVSFDVIGLKVENENVEKEKDEEKSESYVS